MTSMHDGKGNLVGRLVSFTVRSLAEERRLVAAGEWAIGEWVKPSVDRPPEPGVYRVRGGCFVGRDRLSVEGEDPKWCDFCVWLGCTGSWPVFVLECEREGAMMWSKPDPEVEP